jgi:hypothetical protein
MTNDRLPLAELLAKAGDGRWVDVEGPGNLVDGPAFLDEGEG